MVGENLIPAPQWIFLAIAWLTLATALSNQKYPLWFEILMATIFLAFLFIVFYPSIFFIE